MTTYHHYQHPVPLYRANDRELGPFYQGPVFVWDIDKTYLETRFSQLRGLLRSPFELGVNKQAVPGTVPLLKGLRGGPDKRAHAPLFLISASPFQLHGKIEQKMLLDGVDYDGITFKDPLRALLRGQFAHLKEQVGFKLAALFLLAAEMPEQARWYLFGDDAERDALIYSIFADVAAGRLRGLELGNLLSRLGVADRHAEALVAAGDNSSERELVDQIFIHLTRFPDGESIAEFGPHVIGCPTMAAAASVLAEKKFISRATREEVERVAQPSQAVTGPARILSDGRWTPRGE